MTNPMLQRRAGVLLHPTSLPGPAAHGTLGAEAFRFIDLLAAAGFTVWQTLPLGPIDASLSPYQMKSAQAGNPLLIDVGELVGAGWLDAATAAEPGQDLDTLLTRAYEGLSLRGTAPEREEFTAFITAERAWLLPYTLFEYFRRAARRAPWWDWPAGQRDREPAVISATLRSAARALKVIAFQQFVFHRQWQRLRHHARDRGIALFGDLPFYMDLDSAEVWWHRRLFRVDATGRAEAVAGVPPDYFSADGQLWGNPLYDWEALAGEDFRWWLDRLRGQLQRFDLLRIDHFRALESYWEVPAGATTARHGRWREAPGAELLSTVRAELGELPLVAEDLGTITPAVLELRDRFALPGMLVLQFAFDGSLQNPYLPANHVENAVVYTGTHDNDTSLGWYQGLDAGTRSRVEVSLACTPGDMPGALIRAAYASPARLAMIPMQDLLGLGSEARMNVPGTPEGNWTWRFAWDEVSEEFAERCRRLAVQSGRC